MKHLFQFVFLVLTINSCSVENITTITFKDGEGLKLTKIGNFNSSYLLIFPSSPRIYNYDSTITKFKNISTKAIKTISFDSKNHKIVDITFQSIVSISNNSIPPCKPESITSPQGYTKDSISKYFQDVKKVFTIHWDNQDSCSVRANEVSHYFENHKITTYKSYALPYLNGVCYSQNNQLGVPLWIYHVASCIFCSENNQYYVFDLFFDKDKPIEYEAWKIKLESNLNCESYAIYANSCNSYISQILCSCDKVNK